MKSTDCFPCHQPQWTLTLTILLLPFFASGKMLTENQSPDAGLTFIPDRVLGSKAHVLENLSVLFFEVAGLDSKLKSGCKTLNDKVESKPKGKNDPKGKPNPKGKEIVPEKIAPPGKEVMECLLTIEGEKFNLILSLMHQDPNNQMFLAKLEHPTPGEVHHSEMAFKLSIKYTENGKQVILDNDSLESIKLAVTKEWPKVVENMRVAQLKQLDNKLSDLLKKHYSTEDKLEKIVNQDFIWRSGEIKFTSDPSIQANFDQRIKSDPNDKAYAKVAMQLGSNFMSLRVPLKNFSESWTLSEKNIDENLQSWFDVKDKSFLQLTQSQVKEKITKAVKEANFELKNCFGPPSGGPSDQDTAFDIEGSLLPNDKRKEMKECQFDSKLKFVSDKYTISSFIYEFGSLHYVHILFDNALQSLESLIDLSVDTFDAKIENEINGFMKSLVIDRKLDGVSEELTIAEITAAIHEAIPSSQCTPNSKETICSANGTQVVVITEISHDGAAMYRIKFLYKKMAKAAADGKGNVVTNQIVLQKYNAYNQMPIIKGMLKKFGETHNQ
jgi:hypothetical protein